MNKSIPVENLAVWKDILLSIENNELGKILRGYFPFGKVTDDTVQFAYILGVDRVQVMLQCLINLLEKKKIHCEELKLELLDMVHDYNFSLVALQYLANYFSLYNGQSSPPLFTGIDCRDILDSFIECNYKFKDRAMERIKDRLVSYLEREVILNC